MYLEIIQFKKHIKLWNAIHLYVSLKKYVFNFDLKSSQGWTYLVLFHEKVFSREKVQSVQRRDHQIPCVWFWEKRGGYLLGSTAR